MKKILIIIIAAIVITMTGGIDCSLRTVYAGDNLVDINVSSSGGKKRKHHSHEEEKTEKEIEIELSRANIEAQEKELKQMQAVQVQVEQVPAIQNAQMPPVQEEAVEEETIVKPKKSSASGTGSSKKTEEPKTAGSDLPIVPIALMIFLTDMLIVAVESAGDFDDYIRRDHIEKLVEKYKKGGMWTKITAKIEISLCIIYSRWKAKSDRNTKSRHEKCNAA